MAIGSTLWQLQLKVLELAEGAGWRWWKVSGSVCCHGGEGRGSHIQRWKGKIIYYPIHLKSSSLGYMLVLGQAYSVGLSYRVTLT